MIKDITAAKVGDPLRYSDPTADLRRKLMALCTHGLEENYVFGSQCKIVVGLIHNSDSGCLRP